MSAVIGLHSAISGAQGLWHLNGSLADFSGNGRTLTQDAGSTLWSCSNPQMPRTYWFNGANRLTNSDAAFRLTGDVSVLFTGLLNNDAALRYFFAQCGPTSASELEAQNFLYSLRINTSGFFEYFSESGAGVDYVGSFAPATPMPNRVHHVAMIRSGTTVDLWLNALLYASLTGITLPTGGTSSQFYIGGQPGGNFASMHASSVLVVNRAISAAEVANAYAETVGAAYPLRAS
jgi:hypothetical protein